MSRPLRAVAGVVLIAVSFFGGGPTTFTIGVSLLLGAALEKKPSSLARMQSQSVMVRSAVQPQEIAFGRMRKSGVVAWFDTSGSSREYLWFVLAVVEHEIDAYETLWIDETPIDISTQIDGSGYVTHTTFMDGEGNKLVKTGFYTGQSSQTADAELVAAFSDWTTTHNGNDVAYFWVRLELDTSAGGTDPENPEANVWSKGWPRDISVTIRGAKVYDPRLDSTQTAIPGSGTHRVDDSSTWEWSENSVLCRAHYIRHDRFGPGYTSSDIDWVTVAEQADIADELVSIPGSTTQKRYTMNGVVSVADTPKAIVESMASADHGVTLFLPEGIKILVGAWEASSYTIDDTWLAGTFSATSALPTDDAYNGVRGQYLSRDANYTLIEFQPRTSSAYETEDGVGRVWSDIVLPFTNEEYTAQRLALIELKKSRQQARVAIECNFKAEQVELYRVVTLNLGGYSGDTFRVIGKTSGTDGVITLSLREEVSTDWDYTVPDLATPPVPPTILRGIGGPLPPTSLAAETVANGILLTWDLPSMVAVSHIEVYAAATNNRAGATLLTRTRSESYLHSLPEDTERYYWIIARAENGLLSQWEPVSSTGGVYGIAGSPGVDGADAVLYYIKPVDGTAIQNGTGTLTVEAHRVQGAVDELLSTGTIKLYVGSTEVTVANGYATGSDGYTGVFDSGDINGAVTVELKDGPTGDPVLDTITLVDIADGLDAVFGYIEPSQSLSWSRAVDQSTWSPTNATLDFDCTFVQAGVAVARRAWRITRAADGTLTGSSTTHKDGDLNISRVTVTELDEGSRAMSVKFYYSYGGDTCAVIETAITSLSGQDGADGTDGADGIVSQLELPSIVVPCDSDGTGYSLTPWGSANKLNHTVNEGGVDVTTSSVQSIVGGTDYGTYWQKGQNGLYLTVEESTGKYFLSDGTWTTDTETFTLRQTYNSVAYDKKLTVTKAKAGTDGGGNGGLVDLIGRYIFGGATSPTTPYAYFRVDSDGDLYYGTHASGPTSFGTWLSSGSASDYEVRVDVTSSSGVSSGSSSTGTWLACSTDRTWYRDDPTAVAEISEVCQLDVKIRLASTGEILDTCTITLEALQSSGA